MAFEGKVIIITGSNSGLGQNAVLRFAKKGAKITLHGQNEDRIQHTLKLLKANGVPDSHIYIVRGSLSDENVNKAIINETVRKFGRIDVLINNAACYELASATDPESMDVYDLVMSVNLRSVILLTKLAEPYLEKTKGNVINISSMLGSMPIYIGIYYSLSKAGVDHYTKASAMRLAPKGIRINAVAAGHIDTQFLSPIRSKYPVDMLNAYKNDLNERTPLHRAADPSEINAVVEFLSSDEASYITGSVVVADGGFLSGILPPQA